MEKTNHVRMIRGIGYYLPRAMKFYNLMSENVAPVIFLITLFFYFIGEYGINLLLPDLINLLRSLMVSTNPQTVNMEQFGESMKIFFNSYLVSLGIKVVRDFFVGIFASVFLITYIKELKGEVYPIKSGFAYLSKKFFKIAVLSLSFSVGYHFLEQFLFIPGVVFYCVYIFYMCYALDIKTNISGAFEASRNITKGHRVEIFSVLAMVKIAAFLLVNFLTSFLISMVISIFSSGTNSMIEIFVSSFIGAITYLIGLKLIVLMYYDLEYGWEPVKEK